MSRADSDAATKISNPVRPGGCGGARIFNGIMIRNASGACGTVTMAAAVSWSPATTQCHGIMIRRSGVTVTVTSPPDSDSESEHGGGSRG